MRVRRLGAALAFIPALCAIAPTQVAAAPPPNANAAVTSLAGPGYCSDIAHRDPASASVRALAVDASGDVFFDTGAPAAGAIARVTADGTVSLLSTSVPSGRPSPTPGVGPSLVPIPGRLAADGSGGVIVAVGARVIDVDADNSVTTIARDPAGTGDSDGTGSTGDGGLARAARFGRATAVATDDAGNVFVADVKGGSDPHASIRFINRGPRSVTLFGGTAEAVQVGAGRIATIAGTASTAGRGPAPSATPSSARGADLPGAAPVMAIAGDRLYLAISAPDTRSARVLALNLGSAPFSAQGVTIPPGEIAAVANAGSRSPGAASFPFSTVTGLAATADGSLYIAEEMHHRVLLADPAGQLSVVAGRAGGRRSDAGFDGDGRPASGTRLNQPFDVKLGGGRVYIADQANDEYAPLTPTASFVRLAAAGSPPGGRAPVAPPAASGSDPPARPRAWSRMRAESCTWRCPR